MDEQNTGFVAALSSGVLTWPALIAFGLGVFGNLLASMIWDLKSARSLPPSSPLSGTRLLGYIVSFCASIFIMFIMGWFQGGKIQASVLVAISALMIGFPVTILLDRFDWVRKNFGGDSLVDSITLGLLGFVYSSLVLGVLGWTFKELFYR